MRKNFKKLLSVLLISALLLSLSPMGTTVSAAAGKNFVVYFPNWGTYNAAHQSINVGMIPWSKVTCINHAFFTVDSGYKLASTDDYADFQATFAHSEGWDPGMIRGHFGEYKYYKTQYPNVKILVSVGGWTRGENFHAMALTSSSRAIFIQSVIDFLKKYPYIDGIDLDWEYPGINRAKDPNDQYDKGCPGGPEDRQNFTSLLREIRAAYNSNGMSGKLLTIAAPGGYDKVDLTEPNVYQQYLDWLNVMTYDIHGAWETTTNHQTAIYANPNDPSATSPVDIKNKYNTDFIMKYYRDTYNIPAYKLNVGSPFYSRGWKNVDPNTGTNGLFANASGAPVGNLDDPWNPGGQNSYGQIKILENTAGYVKYRDSYSMVPWLYNKSLGIVYTYEDETSAAARCDYVNNNGFGGIIGWEISVDASGFPLTNVISSKLGINGIQTVSTPVFNPAGGTYSSAQPVTITCATSGATIRYTTDGSEPASTSAAYSAPINVTGTTTIKAKAFKSGMNDSATAIAAYTINNVPGSYAIPGQIEAENYSSMYEIQTEACSDTGSGLDVGWIDAGDWMDYNVNVHASGTYTVEFRLAGVNPAGTLQLQKNGTVLTEVTPPNTNGWQTWRSVTASVSLTAGSQTLRLYSTGNGYNINWMKFSAAPAQAVATPVFSPGGGTYTTAQNVTISCATPGAAIRYTTDGSTPTSASTQYTGPISVTGSETIKAIAIAAGMTDSAVASAAYTINNNSGYPAWAPNTYYSAGDMVSYGGSNYRCIQSHTSLPGWEPSVVPALWGKI